MALLQVMQRGASVCHRREVEVARTLESPCLLVGVQADVCGARASCGEEARDSSSGVVGAADAALVLEGEEEALRGRLRRLAPAAEPLRRKRV